MGGGAYRKDADELARRVRAQGYECEARDGHVYLVWKKGQARVLANFPAHPSHADWKLRAIAGLRKAGVEVNGSKKESRMAQEAREGSEALRERVKGFMAERGYNYSTLALAASRMIKTKLASGEWSESEIQQFGSLGSGKSTPEQIASLGIGNLVGGRQNFTQMNVDRWNMVLDALEMSDNGASPSPASGGEPVDTRTVIEVDLEDPESDDEPEPDAEAQPEGAEFREDERGDVQIPEDKTHEVAFANELSEYKELLRVAEDERAEAHHALEALQAEKQELLAKLELASSAPGESAQQMSGRMGSLSRQLNAERSKVEMLERQLKGAHAQIEELTAGTKADFSNVREAYAGMLLAELQKRLANESTEALLGIIERVAGVS